jgi:hypothetical protein
MFRGCNQALAIVADHSFEDHVNAQQIDLLGEIEGVRIHAERREQLGANRDDLSVHG